MEGKKIIFMSESGKTVFKMFPFLFKFCQKCFSCRMFGSLEVVDSVESFGGSYEKVMKIEV